MAFCRKLARAGLERRPDEGPLAFGHRASGELPARAESISAITRLYADIRYGRPGEPSAAARLRQLVRAFSP
jgi:protein-glutamine gamma-glutamyltransferase